MAALCESYSGVALMQSVLRQVCLPICLCPAVLAISAVPALAAEGTPGASEIVFFIQLGILMLVGRVMGEIMIKVGQPSVMGYLLAGIMLGPSLLGLIWPDLHGALFPVNAAQKTMLEAISQFGILVLLLLTGMETDLKLVSTVKRAAVSVSVAGVAVPLLAGFAFGMLMPAALLPHPKARLVTSLFLGTALSISSIKTVAAVVREMKFGRRNLGQVIVASAILEDTIGWVIVAITFGIAADGNLTLWTVLRIVLGAGLFMLVSLTAGRRIVHWLIRWVNDYFSSEFPVITVVLVVMIVMAVTTDLIGIHTVLGAFVAGVIVGESPILSRHIQEQLRGLIVAFFMPVFFAMAGLSADLTILGSPALLGAALALIAIASLGKFAGAFAGGTIGGLNHRESLALACGMNARGSTEIIIGTIGLSMGELSKDLFTMIAAMALVTTMAMPPLLRMGLKRVPASRAETKRLQREKIEAKGFVTTLERLLLAVDDSCNGRAGSRLAGILAGARGIPTTVMPLASHRGSRAKSTHREEQDRRHDESAEAAVKAADEAMARTHNPDNVETAAVDVTVRHGEGSDIKAVADEARKGYGLLFIGLDKPWIKDDFSIKVSRLTAAFEGPLALVVNASVKRPSKNGNGSPILVPVNATPAARHAAEVAIVLARVHKAPIEVLYVAETTRGHKRATNRDGKAVLKDIVKLAKQYKQPVDTAIISDRSPELAILNVMKEKSYDFAVLGVTRRVGDRLSFGATAASVIAKSKTPVLLVST